MSWIIDFMVIVKFMANIIEYYDLFYFMQRS